LQEKNLDRSPRSCPSDVESTVLLPQPADVNVVEAETALDLRSYSGGMNYGCRIEVTSEIEVWDE
jgi:hypothetical protein